MNLTKEVLGQFYTPSHIVKEMVALIENKGSILEPSCGPGAFLEQLPPETIGIELDPKSANPKALILDFFDYTNTVDTIIGNPPYVRYQDIIEQTKSKLLNFNLDNRSNLYLFFIEHSINLLNPEGGELIFIVPRDFIKTTSALPLNTRLYNEGGFTYWKEFGDEKIFDDASPNVAIFRWVKNGKHTIPVSIHNGFLSFYETETQRTKIYLSSLFDVMVGGASGANDIFIEDSGNIDLVVSDTKRTGLTKKAHYVTEPSSYLANYKTQLMGRRIKSFNENNWWEWGRKIRNIEGDKIYVNSRTRDMQPFFTHESGWFDGSLLALVPKEDNPYDINTLIEILNNTDWNSQGFLVGGRLIFGQRSLLNAYILI